MPKIYCIATFLLALSLGATAQNQEEQPKLNTDRPTRTQSPTVIAPGKFQLETGVDFKKDKQEELVREELYYQEGVLRIGLLKWAEFRLQAGYEKQHEVLSPGSMEKVTDEKGFTDIAVGAKFSLFKSEGWLPSVGFLGQVNLPLGNKEFRPPHAAPLGVLLFNNKISDKVEVQYNIGYQKEKEEEAFKGEAVYSVSTSLKLSEKVKYFVEYFGEKQKGSIAENTLDTGVMVKVLPNLQFDLLAGTGLNNKTTDFISTIGLTWRIPN